MYTIINLILGPTLLLPGARSVCCRFHHSQDGTAEDDKLFAATMVGSDGSIVLAGETNGNWEGESSGKMDFAAIKLGADGSEIWRWQVKTCVAVTFHFPSVVAANKSQGLSKLCACDRTSLGKEERVLVGLLVEVH